MNQAPTYQVLQQAAAWYALLGSERVTEQDRHKWRHWLEQHAEHRQAWSLVERVGGRFGQFSDGAHKQGAYAALQSRAAPRIDRRRALLSLGVVGLGGWLGWRTLRQTSASVYLEGWWADYSTHTGENRQVQLASGARLWLNTLSAVDLDGARLKVIAGEINLDDRRAREGGVELVSAFGQLSSRRALLNLRLGSDEACVDVYEGRVEVLCNGQRQSVAAGEQLTFSKAGVGVRRAAQEGHRAWMQGVLVADGMPLGQVVAELACYRHGYLGCDPQVAQLPVVGTFSIRDTDRALASLASALPVRVARTLPWWVTLQGRA